MKQALYLEEAKRMYVREGFGIDTILILLKNQVSRKTLFNWKTQGNWDEQRAKFGSDKSTIQEDLMDILIKKISEAKINPAADNINALGKMFQLIKDAQQIGAITEPITPVQEEQQKKTITPEIVAQIQKELLGIG